MILFLVFVLILILYCGLLVLLIAGWRRVARPTNADARDLMGISIVVPCRNEEQNLEVLMKSLTSLSYPVEKFEVLLINDHSTDDTWSRMNELSAGKSNIRCINLQDEMEGKKQSLSFGISMANHELIATTDADSRHGWAWLIRISEAFHDPEVMMTAGPVMLSSNGSFFSSLQVTEFNSLVGVTAAAIELGRPVMCNGASLAFRKQVFTEVGGYKDNLDTASGDDEFLMRKILRQYPQGIRFLKHADAIVTASPAASPGELVQQRLRWASKWSANTDPVAQYLALFIILVQMAFIGFIVQNILDPGVTLGILIFKILAEGSFLFMVGRWMKQPFHWLAFIALQILYPIYSVGIGVLSFFVPYRWKGRNYE